MFVFIYRRTSNGKSLLGLSRNTQYLWFNPSQQLSTALDAMHASKRKQGIPIFRHTFSQSQENRAPSLVLHTKSCGLVLMFLLQSHGQNTLYSTSSYCPGNQSKCSCPAQQLPSVSQVSLPFLGVRSYTG